MAYYNPEKLISYRSSVVWFCCYLSQYIKLSRQQEKGLHVSKRKLIFSANMAELYTSDVIESKAALGLDGGINFIGDHHFKDFSIIDFEIVGDKAKVYPTVSRFVKGFPDHTSHYDYETGLFALALGWSDQMKDLYPADLELRPKRDTSGMSEKSVKHLDDILNSPERVIDMLTFCPITCLDKCTSVDELKRTYRALCKTYHPDNSGIYGNLFVCIKNEYNKRLKIISEN